MIVIKETRTDRPDGNIDVVQWEFDTSKPSCFRVGMQYHFNRRILGRWIETEKNSPFTSLQRLGVQR